MEPRAGHLFMSLKDVLYQKGNIKGLGPMRRSEGVCPRRGRGSLLVPHQASAAAQYKALGPGNCNVWPVPSRSPQARVHACVHLPAHTQQGGTRMGKLTSQDRAPDPAEGEGGVPSPAPPPAQAALSVGARDSF